MSKRSVLSLILGILLLAPWIPADEETTIRVWLFQGTWMGDEPGLKEVEILRVSSHPEMYGLKTLVGGPESESKAALIDALLNIKNLRTLDDLFLSEKTLDEARPSFSYPVLGKQIAYRVDLSFKKPAPQQVALRTIISKTKGGALHEEKTRKRELSEAYKATQEKELMEKLVDQELLLVIDDPVIVGVPYKDQAYFMVILLTRGKRESTSETSKKENASGEPEPVAAPPPIHKVMPIYPDKLKDQDIRGVVGLRATIDKDGNVEIVEVVAQLHPYLDYSAVRAFKQWTFEPVLRKGKPVRAVFNFTFNFDPRLYSEEMSSREEAPAGLDQASQEELRRILSGCAEYCRKLARSVLDFICEETISETHHQVKEGIDPRDLKFTQTEQIWENPVTGGGIVRKWATQIMDPGRTERNTYICDYQFIKKGDRIEERRILLKENGRRVMDQKKLLEEKRYSVLTPIFASLQVLDQDRQPLFNYKILEEEKVHGKKAFVIEAAPKSGDADSIQSAKIWVDKASFQILKSEIEGVPLDGYEDVLKDSVLLNIEPLFLTTHEYRVEKKGVLFPEFTAVRVEYRGLRYGRPVSKLKTDMTYKKFKFFVVETDHKIIR
jgi:TonB family protein